MANKYRAAVIGCGRIGSKFDEDPKRKYIATHAGAYSHVKKSTLVAVCDIDKRKLNKCARKWTVPKGYTDYRTMMERDAIDVVSVCTPPTTHYPLIKDLVNYKSVKAIFCEKPISDNTDDGCKIVKLCEEHNIILQVDHQRRFDSLHQRLQRSIQNKELGEAQQANFYYTAGIRNTGSHMFDLLRFLFGEIEWIEAFFSKNKSYNKDDPDLDGMVRFKNGLLTTFQACNAKNYLIFELNCFFEKGKIVLKDSGFDVDFYKTRDSAHFSGYKELYKIRSNFNTEYKRNFMVNAVKHLLDCIEKKRNTLSSGMDGLKALEIIEKGINSARNNGRRMYLD